MCTFILKSDIDVNKTLMTVLLIENFGNWCSLTFCWTIQKNVFFKVVPYQTFIT